MSDLLKQVQDLKMAAVESLVSSDPRAKMAAELGIANFMHVNRFLILDILDDALTAYEDGNGGMGK